MTGQKKSHTAKTGPLLKFFGVLCLILAAFLCVQCANPQSEAGNTEIPASPPVQSTAPVVTAPPPSPSPSPSLELSPSPSPSPPILPYLVPKYGENPDIIGWMRIKGTPVDYPVMYSPDYHDFYLTHDFKKKKSKNGLLVLQADCDPYMPGTNLIIHGHNMKSGKMFGTLDNYRKKSYWKKHPVIKFDTLYAQGVYEIVSVFRSRVYKEEEEDVFRYYRFTDMNTPEVFDRFYTNIKKASLYDTGVTAKLGDSFITLSTCAYHVKDGRFVVVAKKVA